MIYHLFKSLENRCSFTGRFSCFSSAELRRFTQIISFIFNNSSSCFFFRKTCLFLVLTLLPVSFLRGGENDFPLYSTEFESPEFSTGSLESGDDWRVPATSQTSGNAVEIIRYDSTLTFESGGAQLLALRRQKGSEQPEASLFFLPMEEGLTSDFLLTFTVAYHKTSSNFAANILIGNHESSTDGILAGVRTFEQPAHAEFLFTRGDQELLPLDTDPNASETTPAIARQFYRFEFRISPSQKNYSLKIYLDGSLLDQKEKLPIASSPAVFNRILFQIEKNESDDSSPTQDQLFIDNLTVQEL